MQIIRRFSLSGQFFEHNMKKILATILLLLPLFALGASSVPLQKSGIMESLLYPGDSFTIYGTTTLATTTASYLNIKDGTQTGNSLVNIIANNLPIDNSYTTPLLAIFEYNTRISSTFTNPNSTANPSATSLLVTARASSTDAYFMDGIYIENITKAIGSTIQSVVGLWVEDQTAGAQNYSIVTNSGDVYHGDRVKIDPDASYFDETDPPAYGLELLGDLYVQDTSTLATTSISKLGVGIVNSLANVPVSILGGSNVIGVQVMASGTTNNYAGYGFRVSTATGSDQAQIRFKRTNSPSSGDGELEFWNSQGGIVTQGATLNSLGHFGIGTTTPETALSVVGTSTLATTSMSYGSWAGDSLRYWKIEPLDLGAGGIYPMLAGYSDGAFGNVGAVADNLIIYDKANDDTLSLIFSNNTGSQLGYLQYVPTTNIFQILAPLSVSGNITASAYDVDANSFTIGGNTLGSTEWSNLDGQDQTVAIASSPIFAGVTSAGTIQGGTLTDGYSTLNNGYATITQNIILGSGKKIKPTSDSTSALKISDAGTSNLMTFDTTNRRILFSNVSGETGVAGAFGGDIVSESIPWRFTKYSGGASAPGAAFGWRAARGTQTTPSAVLLDDQIFGNGISAYHSGSAFSTGGNTGFWAMYAGENFTSTAQGTYHAWGTTAGGGVSRRIKMVLSPSGTLWLGDSDNSPVIGTDFIDGVSKLHIDQGTGVASNLRFTANATTGRTSSDGFSLGIDSSANAYLRQYENLPMYLYTNNALRMTIEADGDIVMGTSTTYLMSENDGDTYWVGDGTGLPFGQMYTNTSIVVPVASANTWYEVNVNAPDFTAGELNEVTFTDHYLTVGKAGRYLINLNASLSTGVALQEFAATVMVNGTATETAHSHGTNVAAGQPSSVGGSTILDLAANDQISVAIQNHSTGADVTVEHAQVSLTMLGGT